MDYGFIKIHRKILESLVWSDPSALKLWMFILLKASHKEREFLFNGSKIKLKSGEFITGRKQLSAQTGISESKIFRLLKVFESEHQIEQQKTNKYSVIRVKNWEKYQIESIPEHQDEQQANNKRTTDEQQVNTNKNEKNVHNEKNVLKIQEQERIKGLLSTSVFGFPTFRVKTIEDQFWKSVDQRKKAFKSETLFEEIATKLADSEHLSDKSWFDLKWLFKNDENLEKFLNGNYDSFKPQGDGKGGLSLAEVAKMREEMFGNQDLNLIGETE